MCPAMRFVVLRRIGLKLGMVVGNVPRGLWSKRPDQTEVKSHPEVNLPYIEVQYGHQIWQKEPMTEVQYIAGVKGHADVVRVA